MTTSVRKNSIGTLAALYAIWTNPSGLVGECHRATRANDPMHRPYDDAFWQMDLVFLRETRQEFSYQQYR